MVGWNPRLNGSEFEQTPEMVKDRQGSLASCSPWGQKQLDTTKQLNNNRSESAIRRQLHWAVFLSAGSPERGGQEGWWLSQSLQALITKDPRCRWRTSSVLRAPREQPQSKESSYQHLQKTRPDTVSKQLICVPGRSFKNILCSLLPLLAQR